MTRTTAQRQLILDDHADCREMYRDYFEFLRFTVSEAADGISGLTAIQNERPSVVLLDLILPHPNGREVLRRLHSDMRITDIPVLVVTAAATRQARKNALAGCDSFLLKPALPEDVAAMYSRSSAR